MRAKREALGEGGKVNIRKVRYKRLRKPRIAVVVWNFYVFLAGMLFSALLMGINVLWLLVGIIILIIITYFRE